ncbi:hypothetical protein [Aeromonas salmonicida]|uniref:hypothetical protein n=1 Tax=Aeromonas salmonicida TaxID=645 RepID=UPI000B2769A4|nr:hypothetical protein [Aeromonas salmonicida]MDE7529098.1 hypothetical protein [Aeromonas salmonicida]MDE7533433.1 hypothetical protein [Aeromonas salmonicida]
MPGSLDETVQDDPRYWDDGGPDAYKVWPGSDLRGSIARQYQPHYVMLVSDGFKVTGE